MYLHVNLHIQRTKHVFPVFIRPPRSSLAVPHLWGFHPTPRGCTTGESWRDANRKGAVTLDVCCKGITVIECHTLFFFSRICFPCVSFWDESASRFDCLMQEFKHASSLILFLGDAWGPFAVIVSPWENRFDHHFRLDQQIIDKKSKPISG